MPSSPLILLVHKMHESGIDLLREAGELRMASGTDPATLQREVVNSCQFSLFKLVESNGVCGKMDEYFSPGSIPCPFSGRPMGGR